MLPPPQTPSQGSAARRLLGMFTPYRQRVTVLVALILVMAVLGTAVVPEVTRLLIDRAFPRKDVALLTVLIAALVVVPVLEGVLSLVKDYLSITLSQHVMRDLRVRLYAHLQALPLRFYYRGAHWGDPRASGHGRGWSTGGGQRCQRCGQPSHGGDHHRGRDAESQSPLDAPLPWAPPALCVSCSPCRRSGARRHCTDAADHC